MSLRCAKCRYNLGATDPSGACPECGTAICDSVEAQRAAGNPPRLAAAFAALSLAGVAAWPFVMPLIVKLLNTPTVSARLWPFFAIEQAAGLICASLAVGGWWKLTGWATRVRVGQGFVLIRQIVRITVCGGLCTVVVFSILHWAIPNQTGWKSQVLGVCRALWFMPFVVPLVAGAIILGGLTWRAVGLAGAVAASVAISLSVTWEVSLLSSSWAASGTMALRSVGLVAAAACVVLVFAMLVRVGFGRRHNGSAPAPGVEGRTD